MILVAPSDKAQCSVLCINSLYALWQHGVQWLALSAQSKKVVGLSPAGAVAILSGACMFSHACVGFFYHQILSTISIFFLFF